MANISADQLRFLAANNIDIALLYDASGQSWNAWRDTMKKIGKKFAFGTSACAAGGHTLRTRHGHCIQCFNNGRARQPFLRIFIGTGIGIGTGI